MTRFEPGPTFAPSARTIEIFRERLERMGLSLTEPVARSLLESVFHVEGARLQREAREKVQRSLDHIRRTAEAALIALAAGPPESSDLVSVVKEHLGAEPESGHLHGDPAGAERVGGTHPPVAARHPTEKPAKEPGDQSEPRPVFKRRRGR